MAFASQYKCLLLLNCDIPCQPFSVCLSKISKPSIRPGTRQHQRPPNARSVPHLKGSTEPVGHAGTLARGQQSTESHGPSSKQTKTNLVESEHNSSSNEGMRDGLLAGALLSVSFLTSVLQPEFVEAAGLALAPEPSNALSLPTWIIHVASVVEWIVAMSLVWRYGAIEGRKAWRGLAWGMLPLLAGAMCACTWHFFYNSPSLEGLVAIQGAMTFLGNCTCWIAAYRIFKKSQSV